MNYRDDTEITATHSPIYGHIPLARSAFTGRFPRTREEAGFGSNSDPVHPMPAPPTWIERALRFVCGH